LFIQQKDFLYFFIRLEQIIHHQLSSSSPPPSSSAYGADIRRKGHGSLIVVDRCLPFLRVFASIYKLDGTAAQIARPRGREMIGIHNLHH
jgi:hypothetical protein